MTTCTPHSLRAYVHSIGGLDEGRHLDSPGCCLFEAISICKGLPKTDDPAIVDRPDYRPLNDGPWPDPTTRAKYMLRLDEAYWDWAQWPVERQQMVMERVVVLTVQRVISDLPRLPDEVREQCRKAQTWAEARAAAWAARAAADAASAEAATGAAAAAWAAGAAGAAEAAAGATWAAAWAALATTAPLPVLIRAVDLWIEAAQS